MKSFPNLFILKNKKKYCTSELFNVYNKIEQQKLLEPKVYIMTQPTRQKDHEEDKKKNNQVTVEHLGEYLKGNYRETLAYALLIIGILLIFFAPGYGELIVGLIAGIYFNTEIIAYFIQWKSGIYTKDVSRHLISAGVIIAFFIVAPVIFLGIAIAVALKQLLSINK